MDKFITYIDNRIRRLTATRQKIEKQLRELEVTRRHYLASGAMASPEANVPGAARAGAKAGATIKDRVQEILSDFPHGLATHELLEKLEGVTRASLTPQLSRLKTDGVIDRDAVDGRWVLVNSGAAGESSAEPEEETEIQVTNTGDLDDDIPF